MNLTNPEISYIIISSTDIDAIMSYLWAKNFNIIPLKGYYKGSYENSIIAYSNIDNDELRSETLFLLDHFTQDCAIVKYRGETRANKIFSDGSQKPMGVVLYNTDQENKSYLLNGLSFSFIEERRYWFPKSKEDFKTGMIVEYFTKNKWLQHKVQEPSSEYENLFKLLIKYNKIRIASIL